jgi:hypothetical protein
MQTSSRWRTPITLLILMSVAMPLAFNTWSALLNNFAVEQAAFTGVEIGMLQSLREVPGFLSFTVIFVLLVIKEQTFAVFSSGVVRPWGCAHWFFSDGVWSVFYDCTDEHRLSLFRGHQAVAQSAVAK